MSPALLEVLARLADAEPQYSEPQVSVSALAGARHQRTWLLSGPGIEPSVLKLPDPHADRLGLNVQNAVLCARRAGIAGAAPKLLWSDASSGATLTRYVATSEEALEPAILGRLLGHVHSLDAEGLQPICYSEAVRRYAALLPGDSSLDWTLTLRLAEELESGSPSLALCHHDVSSANVVGTGRERMLIDWEYAGLGDPRFDLAAAVVEFALDDRGIDALFARYPGSDAIDRLPPFVELYRSISALWHAVNRSSSVDTSRTQPG